MQSIFAGIGGGGGFDWKEETKEYLKSTKTTISCFRNGSPVGNTVFTIEQMIENFKEFQTMLEKRKEKGGVKYISLFADYDQLIETRNYRILRPELKELKRKLKDIRATKTQRQIEILVCENKLRFGDSNSSNLPQQIRKLEDSVSKIQDFIRRCEIEPELISSQEYKEILKYKEIIDTKI